VTSVGTSAVLLTSNSGAVNWTVTNAGPETVYLGSTNGVTIGNGSVLFAGDSFTTSSHSAGAHELYGITAGGTTNVSVLVTT
jgi:hypothetical protein